MMVHTAAFAFPAPAVGQCWPFGGPALDNHLDTSLLKVFSIDERRYPVEGRVLRLLNRPTSACRIQREATLPRRHPSAGGARELQIGIKFVY